MEIPLYPGKNQSNRLMSLLNSSECLILPGFEEVLNNSSTLFKTPCRFNTFVYVKQTEAGALYNKFLVAIP